MLLSSGQFRAKSPCNLRSVDSERISSARSSIINSGWRSFVRSKDATICRNIIEKVVSSKMRVSRRYSKGHPKFDHSGNSFTLDRFLSDWMDEMTVQTTVQPLTVHGCCTVACTVGLHGSCTVGCTVVL